MSKKQISTAAAPRLRWYHGLLFYAVVTVLSGPWLPTSAYLDVQGRPPFMPPDWVFPPVWILNNSLMIWAGMRVLNMTPGTPNRKVWLMLQALSWIGFISFSWVYFALHSPILGLVVTTGMWAINLRSVFLGLKIDRAVSLALAPLMIWLTLASMVAGYQALHTPDELFGLPPLVGLF
ncbi:MAG: tryptophan-rich sensory protein [Chlorobiales bacterium]|jgi:translocator protein|nr:tryptophan-rich sensory protein [Chlorobiales bacterium]